MIRRTYNVLALLLITAATAVAQDATVTTATPGDPSTIRNKKGEAYFPVADEWALGISANPFLDYLGNFINGFDGFQSAPSFDFAANPASNIAVYGKKMIDANTAYRVRFNVSVRQFTNKDVVTQDLVNANPQYPSFADDWQKVNTTSIVIAPGWEKRRGSTRLQGIYGGELVIGFNANRVKYEYGNAMTADFQAPTTTNFSGQGYGNNLPNGSGSVRATDAKIGGSFLVGARGFIGVEYFFVPKMSIGGEFGYMVAYQTQRRNETTYQVFDGATNGTREVKVPDYDSGGRTNLGIGLDNLSGSINLLFYF